MIHTVKGFSLVNKAEIDVFLELSCCFYDPVDVGNLISGSSAFSKSSLDIWYLPVHVLLKPSLKDFECYLASMWNECNCVVVWTFFGIALLWDLNENWPVLVLWPLLSFPKVLTYWVQHFNRWWFYQLNPHGGFAMKPPWKPRTTGFRHLSDCWTHGHLETATKSERAQKLHVFFLFPVLCISSIWLFLSCILL